MADLKEGDLKEGGDAGGDGGDGEAVLTSKTDDNMSSGAPWSRSSGGAHLPWYLSTLPRNS